MTAPVLRTESVTAAVTGLAARCDGPTLATLTAVGDTVTARPETLPGGPRTADSITVACERMATVIARHPAMFTAEVVAYAVILPGDGVAFAADRTGLTHFIPLTGVPSEPLHSTRWDDLVASLHAMIDAAAH
ncbi:hypothetical protein [Actinoplanes sp. TFC3]|uniref:hypothetical protein n=1 Tax=Actinoplanes sp. TFC3 TaxID=1710355 RepID=UPI000AF5556E|nr:hypothetical protein [Actinoplanes sp. TFC3]